MTRLLATIALLTFAACNGGPTDAEIVAGQQKSVQQGPTYNGLSLKEVQKLYASCKVCHGIDGKKMFGGASDLSQSEFTMDERIAIIKSGKGKMTPYEGRLNDDEMRALAEYIELFRE